MKPTLKILAVVLALLLVGGLITAAVGEVRAAAARMKCQNNLRQIGLALENYHDSFGRYPAATVRDVDLPPERRLSWYVEIFPFVEARPRLLVDRAKAWDDPENWPPREAAPKGATSKTEEGSSVVESMKLWLCPMAAPVPNDLDQPSVTHYVGIAGLGRDAAELPLDDPRAGFFGHDRKLTKDDVEDGLGTTLVVLEALDGGPWTAGGRSTVRGLVPDGTTYVGGQFQSSHRRGWPFAKRTLTNALFADGSVRPLNASLSPQVIEALATVAAGDEPGALAD